MVQAFGHPQYQRTWGALCVFYNHACTLLGKSLDSRHRQLASVSAEIVICAMLHPVGPMFLAASAQHNKGKARRNPKAKRLLVALKPHSSRAKGLTVLHPIGRLGAT